MIDFINEEDAVEVYDFIGYLNMKREKEELDKMYLDAYTEDKQLIYQIQKSRDDRKNGRI